MVAVVASPTANIIYRRGGEAGKSLAQATSDISTRHVAPSFAVSAAASCTHSASQRRLLAHALRAFAGERGEMMIEILVLRNSAISAGYKPRRARGTEELRQQEPFCENLRNSAISAGKFSPSGAI